MVDWVAAPAGTITHTDARALELAHQLLEAVDIGDVRVAVVSDDGVAGAADALAHVAAHLAETDETELHQSIPYVRVRYAYP